MRRRMPVAGAPRPSANSTTCRMSLDRFLVGVLIDEPAPTPDQVRGRLSPRHALIDCRVRTGIPDPDAAVERDVCAQTPLPAQHSVSMLVLSRTLWSENFGRRRPVR